MHAHQSKAPRATLQHTHTYSTHSTAGTDQFICLMAIATSPTTLSQITGELQCSVHIAPYHSMSRSMRMMVDMLIAITTSG